MTCGRWKAGPPLDKVRDYFRDVHSVAMARRPGIYHYRTNKLGPVLTDLFDLPADVTTTCPSDQQLHFVADVRHRDQSGLDAFLRAPEDAAVRSRLLQDIELFNQAGTTYRVLPDNGRTYADRTGDPTPQGRPNVPTFAVFVRQRANDDDFRRALRALAEGWSAAPGVARVRLCLFERPDMEAERKAGYPVKTHPAEQQHQAWIDLSLDDQSGARALFTTAAIGTGSPISVVHAYPVIARYTFVHDGRPTPVGLRGYGAARLIEELGATNQSDESVLRWMYGPAADGEAR